MNAKADLLSARTKTFLRSGPVLVTRALRGMIEVGGWLAATLLAFTLHFEGAVPVERWPVVLLALAVLTALKVVASRVFGLNRPSWERLSFRDARNVILASGSVAVAATLLARTVGTGLDIPVSVPIVDGLLTALFMLGARGVARHVAEARLMRRFPGRKLRAVLLIGAGEAGSMLGREMLRHPETGMRPVGFVDDDPAKVGRTISGVPVLGRLDDIGAVLQNELVDEVLITIPSADGSAIRQIVERVRAANPGIAYRTMPALHELLSGEVTINRIREVGIDDLLRRPTVELDTDSILSYLQGKRVMVTGAGGSIGSELVRQICRFGPHELILFGHGENSIYQLERELDLQWPGVRYQSVIAAVQNVRRLDYVFRRYRPDVVFHTAAHKHVPLMEQNPEEAVFNNVIGTRNLVRLALKHGVTHFVNVSTDKAVHPSSVMGASKRIAELIVEDAARDASAGQIFVSVRFGNVLGSRGSAVPIFKQQIKAGGPVTVTHPDMTRYFMTIPEASRLVLQASALGRNGKVYILDMGEPVRVLDLVKDLIRLSGLEPDVDIPIVFTGVRPGEKLTEELMTEDERQGRTEHDKIFVATPHPVSRERLDATVDALQAAALRSDGVAIRQALADAIDGATLLQPRDPDDAVRRPADSQFRQLVN
jgi:FlaA1/EpsC-like NDP-sugar epimerase